MPVLYINSSRKRGLRVRGRARVKLRRAKHRKNPTRKVGSGGRTRHTRMSRKVRRARKQPKRSTMARRRKKKSHARKARRTPRRRHGGKKRVAHKRRRRARKAAPKRRRRRSRRAAPKRRRRRRARKAAPKRRRRRRAKKSRRRARRKSTRRRSRRRRSAVVAMGPSNARTVRAGTLVGYRHNPRRRRRSRRRYSGSRKRRSRRVHRRYGRHSSYRKNPGQMLIDLAKKALPVLVGFYGARLFASKIGPMLPMVSSLGTFAGPAVAIGTVVGINFATKKVSFLAKHRETLLLGSALAALDSLIQAFAPASVKALIGVGDVYDRALGDYVQMGDYVAMGGAQPLNDRMTMSDYISVGGDGVEQDLGLEEELGALEELGAGPGDLGANLGGTIRSSMMKQIGTMQFVAPVPARSFTQEIAGVGTQYDSAGEVAQGIFAGGMFGGH